MKEDYCSFEIAKLLKEKGFNEWCFHCYGVAVLHNGVDISFDEECELKDEGRENEIEYIEGGRLYDYGCNNSDKDAKVWAAPTLWMAMKWLREAHKLHITIKLYGTPSGIVYAYEICKLEQHTASLLKSKSGFENNENACEAAILECLTNLI